MSRASARLTAVCGFALATGLVGCTLLALPGNLPPTVDAVMADAALFAPPSDDVLADVAAGTVRDDLHGLDGCWGGYQRWEANLGQALEISEALHFDASSGTLTRYVEQQLAGLAIVFVQHGTYEVAPDGDRIAFHVQTIQSNIRTGRLTDDTDLYDTLPQYTVYATLSGEELKTRFEMPAHDPRTPAGFADNLDLWHRGFDCPAE
jgi:hypothetical protein